MVFRTKHSPFYKKAGIGVLKSSEPSYHSYAKDNSNTYICDQHDQESLISFI